MNTKPLDVLLVLAALASPVALTPAEDPAASRKENAPPPAAASKEAAPASIPLEITIDTTEAPEMAEWAAQAKELCLKNYVMILGHLGAEGFTPPDKVKIVFKNMRGVAHASGRTITCAAAWFKEHPDDYGAVIHELCHVAQSYRSRVPSWVTEGIADYVRWFHYEPPDKRPKVNPRRAKHTDSYRTTAAFFDWIVRAKDKTFVTRLNASCRAGKYKPELFQEYAGKMVEELWAEFIVSIGGTPGGKRARI